MERLIQESVLTYFNDIEDPRVMGRCKHKLIDVIAVAVCAFICGAESFSEMEQFGHERELWFREFLELPNGIPSHDTILRVFTLLNPQALETSFRDWVESVKAVRSKRICLDGKTVNGTNREFNGKRRPLSLVNVYCNSSGLVLCQSEAPSTGNAEVATAVQCIDSLDLTGALVSMDAGLAKPVILKKLREKKAHYVVPIKSNLRTYFEEIKGHFASTRLRAAGEVNVLEESHGRIEERRCILTPAGSLSPKFHDAFQGAKSVFVIHRKRDVKDKRYFIQKTARDGRQHYVKNTSTRKVTEETIYYVSSKKLTAKKALDEARSHWAIENKLHWSLDVVFGEDDCRVRQRVAARNLALLRKIAFNLVQAAPGKGSKRLKLKKASWNPNYLEKLLLGTLPP